MATFNPDTPQVGSQNYINYSNRQRGENIWGTLFEGVVNAVDENNQANAKQEATNAVDKITNDYFGTKDFSDTFLNKGDGNKEPVDDPKKPDVDPETVPGPVKDGVNRIQTLSQAKDAGKLTEKNYAGQLDAAVREIKAKYPGYGDYVDQAVSKALNQPTANMLRNAIIAEQNRQASSLSDQIKEDRKFADTAIANGDISEATFKKIYSGEVSPDQMLEIRAKVGTLAAGRADVDNKIKKAELTSKDRANGRATVEQEQDRHYDAASSSVDLLMSNTFYKLTGDTGEDYAKFQEEIKTYQSNDGRIDEAEMAKLVQHAQSIDAALRTAYSTLMQEPQNGGSSRRTIMGADRATKVDASFEARMEPIKRIINGDKNALTFLNWNATMQKANDESNAHKILNTPTGKMFENAGILSKASNGALNPHIATAGTNALADGSGPTMKDLQSTLVIGAVGQNIVEGKTVTDTVVDLKKNTDSKTAAQATAGIIDFHTKVILDPKVDEETRAKSFKAMYDPSLLSKMTPTSAQMVYRSLANPTMAAEIMKLAEKDPTIKDQYRQFILTQGKALNKQTESDAQEAVTFFEKGRIVADADGSFHVRLDPKAFKDPEAALEFLKGGGQIMAGRGGAMRTMSMEDRKQLELFKSAQKAVGEINLYLDGVRVLLDAEGVKDPQKRAEVLHQAMDNINLNAPKQNTWIKSFNQALDDFFTVKRDTNDTGIGKYTLPDIGLRIGKPGEPALVFGGPTGVRPTPDQIREKNRQDELNKNADVLKDFKLSNTFEPGTETPAKRTNLMARLVEDEGLNKIAAAGVVGNLMHESNLKPGAEGDSGSSIGWAQWHATRKDDFLDWAKEKGMDPNTDEANYAYLVHDLKVNYPDTLAKMQKAKTVEEATDIFMNEFEAPRLKARESRVGHAKRALDSYGQ